MEERGDVREFYSFLGEESCLCLFLNQHVVEYVFYEVGMQK